MNNKFLLSIIIPVYNMEQYLSQCLHSIYIQKFSSDVEIILIDDGSTDDSARICDEAKKNTYNLCFQVFHIQNKGISAARNYGITKARGEYIAWIDSDDYIAENWWKVIQPILLHKPDMIYFDMKMLINRQFEEYHYAEKSQIISREELITSLAENKMMSQLWSKILPRKVYIQNSFDESLPSFEDFDILHRITFDIDNCIYIHNCLYIYRKWNASLTSNIKKKLQNSYLEIQVVKKRIEFYHEHGIEVNDYPIARQELKFLLDYLKLNKGMSLHRIRKEFAPMIKHVRENRHYMYFNKKVGIEEVCFLYLLFFEMKPLLWITSRHPIRVFQDMKNLLKMSGGNE